jgi:hypothetical protein
MFERRQRIERLLSLKQPLVGHHVTEPQSPIVGTLASLVDRHRKAGFESVDRYWQRLDGTVVAGYASGQPAAE